MRWKDVMEKQEETEKQIEEKKAKVLAAKEIWIVDFTPWDSPWFVRRIEKEYCSKWEIEADAKEPTRPYLHFGEYDCPWIGESIGGDMIIHLDDVFLSKEEADEAVAALNAERAERIGK